MTVLIGYSCPDFAILGADGLSTSVDDPNDVHEYTEKLFKTGFGIIGGAGRTDVIYAVTHNLANHAPGSSEEASAIIREEVAKLDLAADDPGLDRTSWLATFATHTGSQVETRLALAHRGTDYSFDAFHHNRVIILRPSDMTAEVGRQFMAAAQSQLDERLAKTPPEEVVGLCIRMIADLVKAISKVSRAVGPRFSVAVHLARNNATAISNVVDDPEAIEWH